MRWADEMKTGFVSSYALNVSLRTQNMRVQSDLQQAQLELSTGKKHDIGLELGSVTSRLVLIKKEIELIDQLKGTNGLLQNRMALMQTSMTQMVDSAQSFIDQLVPQSTGSLDRNLLAEVGLNGLAAVEGAINVTFKGEFIFSGINTDMPALTEYDSQPISAARTAVQNAFFAEFGFNPGDPAAAALTDIDMETFINGTFATLFDDTNWPALWTGSADRGIRTKVSTMETVEVSVTAIDQPFRDMVSSMVLMAEFSNSQLNETALDKMLEISIEKTAGAISGLSVEQSILGLSEERVNAATERISLQSDLFERQTSAMEDVDLYEVTTRLNQISINLEASYTATARIQNLSLMNYI